MRALIPSLILLLTCACSADEERLHERLMVEIEAKVRLPARAHKLDAYARFYAFDADGTVVARYLIPSPVEEHPNWACVEIVDININTREVPCPPEQPFPPEGKAGERRWVKSPRAIPYMADGGCLQVNIIFDPRSGRLEASCNGYL